jgi:hypothetical protein
VGTRGLTVTENGKGSGVGTLGLERWRGLRLGDGAGATAEAPAAWGAGVGRWRERLGGARSVGRRLGGGTSRRQHGVRTK